jgi:Leucine Rich repeat
MTPETPRRLGRNGIGPTLAAVLCAVTVGCAGSPPPPVVANPDPTPDGQVLLALDCYDPMYQVDEDGRVTRLNLVWRHLPGPVLAEIGKLTELRHIDLAHTTLTDDGLAQLKDLQKLRSIGLSGTEVTDQGLVHLEKLQSLQWVWLSRNKVTEAAVEKLKEARPDLNVYLQ